MNTCAIGSLSLRYFINRVIKKQVKLLDCLLVDYFGHRILSGFLLSVERQKIGNSVMIKNGNTMGRTRILAQL